MRDLLSDLNNLCLTRKVAICVRYGKLSGLSMDSMSKWSFLIETYAKISVIAKFSLFFQVFKHDFISCVILPASQLQTQQVMTSWIKSHIEYLIHTYYITVLIVEIDEKSSFIGGF